MQSGLLDFEPEKIKERHKQKEEDRKVMDLLGRFTAQMLKDDLRKDGHPKPEWGDVESWRHYYLDECRHRGTRLLEDLGWPTDENSIYVNIYTGCLRKLIHVATDGGYFAEKNISNQVWSIVEHWEPFDGSKPNIFLIRYLREKIASLREKIRNAEKRTEYIKCDERMLKEYEAKLEAEEKKTR